MSSGTPDPPLRVTVVRSGGFAGMTARFTADTTALPGEQARQLRRMVGELDPEALRATPSGGGADRFTYDVHVDRGGAGWQARVPEQQAPPALRELLNWLAEHRQP